MKKMYFVIAIISALSLFNATAALSADTLPFYAASGVEPNILIILDRSGSMSGDVGGGSASTPCPTPAYPNPLTTTGDYSRICIARQVLFDLLDANNSNSVTDTPTATADQTYLGARLGYSRFISVPSSPATGASEGGGYAGGNIRVINDVGTSYATLWASINNLSTGQYTPLGTALSEALQYFQNASAVTGDVCFTGGCRKNYVILVTDGEDTVTCTAGSGSIANRRATVYAAKALHDAGIDVFVVGFGGGLSVNLQRTLNWAAYYGYGGVDPNPNAANDDTGSFTPGAALCDSTTGAANDPGAQAKLGYAFLASNATDLATSIKAAIDLALTGSYTRSQPVLTISGNSVSGDRIYSGFFDLPYWKGHLDAWNVDSTTGAIQNSTPNDPCTSSGTNAFSELYDAGRTLTYSNCGGYVAPADRKVYTNIGLSQILFNISGTGNTDAQQIDLCTALSISGFNCAANYAAADTSGADNNPNELINFIRFFSTTFNGSAGTRLDSTAATSWKLGDIWHSTPTIVGSPVGSFSSAGYNAFKTANSTRRRVLIVGANDGMLHAFDDGTPSLYAGVGSEVWSFIPNNLLGKLKDLNAGHAFYVDASPTAADVCLNTANCGKSAEVAADWKTVVITGERDGGNAYFALDITDTTNPMYLWQFTDGNLGYTWSKPAIGKVRIKNGSNYEDHWVTFFGGGTSTTDDVGNRFYAVDIGTGDTLGAGANKTEYTIGGVANKVPSAPRVMDLNGDFYVDAAFFGDTDGRLWKLNTTNTNPNNWLAGEIFDPSLAHKTISCTNGVGTLSDHSTGLNGLRPIYYRPAIVFDSDLKPLIMFGTGFVDDNTQPGSTVQNYFYITRLESSAYSGISSPNQYITEILSVALDPGETVVGAPFVFDGYVWYVTYKPQETATCCSVGTGKLRWAELKTCGATGEVDLGSGIPQAGAGSDIYTITSNDTKPKKCTTCPSGPGNLSDVIYWREK